MLGGWWKTSHDPVICSNAEILRISQNLLLFRKPLMLLVFSIFLGISCSSTPSQTVFMSMPSQPPNWTPPERMTASERLDELAQILCVGLRRILPEQSSSLSAPAPDSLVDFSPLKSGVRRHKLRNRVGG
jgi:hypothetical protein